MAELSKVTRCYHCGVVLQTIDESKSGYINNEVIERYPEGLLLCNDCFKNERFNTKPKEVDFDENYRKILDEIIAKKALVVYVVDIFSFEGSFITKVNESLKGIDVLAVANKRDLLPANYEDEELLEYVKHRLRVSKLDVKDAILVSSNTSFNIINLISKIISMSKGRDVYFVGASESGKTAIISEILKNYKNETKTMISTITFKGTNLRGFRIPFNEKNFIFETPGTSIDNSMCAKVEQSVVNCIVPSTTIKPKEFKLSKGSNLMVGGLAAFELIDGEKSNIIAYFSSKVGLETSKNEIGKNIDKIIKRKKLSPLSKQIVSFADFDAYDIQITETGERDIGILGLGWISFIGNNQTFRVYIPKGVYVYTTRSKIKHVNK